MRCPAAPGSARELRAGARERAAPRCRRRRRRRATPARGRAPTRASRGSACRRSALEPREQRVERAPALRLGGELRLRCRSATTTRGSRAPTISARIASAISTSISVKPRARRRGRHRLARAGCRGSRPAAPARSRGRRVGDGDLDLAKRRIRRARDRLAPDESARPPASASPSRASRAPGQRRRQLRRGEAVLRDPQRQRALLEQRRAVGRLRERAHAGRQRDRDDRQRDQDFDQREAAARADGCDARCGAVGSRSAAIGRVGQPMRLSGSAASTADDGRP